MAGIGRIDRRTARRPRSVICRTPRSQTARPACSRTPGAPPSWTADTPYARPLTAVPFVGAGGKAIGQIAGLVPDLVLQRFPPRILARIGDSRSLSGLLCGGRAMQEHHEDRCEQSGCPFSRCHDPTHLPRSLFTVAQAADCLQQLFEWGPVVVQHLPSIFKLALVLALVRQRGTNGCDFGASPPESGRPRQAGNPPGSTILQPPARKRFSNSALS